MVHGRKASHVDIHRPLRILMVEDDALVSSVIVPALEAEGHTVELATSADAALLRLAAGMALDVLFTDVVMPGNMNGIDLARWAREHRPELGIVVATGYAPTTPDAQMKVLRKPYRSEELLQALASAADERRAQRGQVTDERPRSERTTAPLSTQGDVS